jgi:LysR family transcriptional regulator AphB
MVDLNDVAIFVQVVRMSSFAEAGRQLGVPPNSVSRRVQQLEQQLGVRLLQRSTRRLTMTDAGQRFYTGCVEQIDALAEAAQAAADVAGTPSGKVRVAAPSDFFQWFPMDSIKTFLDAHPRVRLEFKLSDALADFIGDSIDVAFRAGKTMPPNVVARRVGDSRVGLFASPNYLLTRGTPTQPEDLVSHDCITLPTAAGGASKWKLDGPDGSVSVTVKGRLQANTRQAQLRAALAGIGIAMLPAMVTTEHLERGTLRAVLPDYSVAGVGLHLVYLSRRQLPRAVRAFIDYLADQVQALPSAVR